MNLLSADHIYLDNTFIRLHEFFQLLTILTHNEISNVLIPAGYILESSKLEVNYTKCLSSLKNIIYSFNNKPKNFKYIKVDYETALINSCQNVFKHQNNMVLVSHEVIPVKNSWLNRIKT
jgi:hypothetical protein